MTFGRPYVVDDAESFEQIGAGRESLCHGLPMLRLNAHVELLHQVVLGRKVVIGVADGDVGFARDQPDGRLLVPSLLEFAEAGTKLVCDCSGYNCGCIGLHVLERSVSSEKGELTLIGQWIDCVSCSTWSVCCS